MYHHPLYRQLRHLQSHSATKTHGRLRAYTVVGANCHDSLVDDPLVVQAACVCFSTIKYHLCLILIKDYPSISLRFRALSYSIADYHWLRFDDRRGLFDYNPIFCLHEY